MRLRAFKKACAASLAAALLFTQQGFFIPEVSAAVVSIPQTVSAPVGNVGAAGSAVFGPSASLLPGSDSRAPLGPSGLAGSLPSAALIPTLSPVGAQSPTQSAVAPLSAGIVPELRAAPRAARTAAPAALPSVSRIPPAGRPAQNLVGGLKGLGHEVAGRQPAQALGRFFDLGSVQGGGVLPSAVSGGSALRSAGTPGLSRSAPRTSDGSWWKDSSAQHVAISVPLYSLRREGDDPGIGKFTDFGRYYRDVLAKQGVDTVHLLPHFAVLDESPYAPVSLYALNEGNIDWAEVAEVRRSPDLQARLVVKDLADRQAVNYKSLAEREGAVALEAYRRFQRDEGAQGTPRYREYLAFVKDNAAWLEDYAQYMALARILGKPSMEWTPADEARARQDPRFGELKEVHSYAQWNAFGQFAQAMDTVHAAGGRVLFDIPMFRAKNSVDAWKHPEYFTDLKTRNPGIRNQYINEDWKDLALWNWTRLKGEGYRGMLEPFRHWLKLGFDGGRVDALHFAYNFGNGQMVSGDEPGDDYVRALSSVFHAQNAFPLAEAFEGKAENALRYGFVTVYGDWKKLSSHDDPRADGFVGRFLGLANEAGSGRNARFLGYTLGDEWGDGVPVKVVQGGKSSWRYRIPLPSDPDYKTRSKADVRGQLGGWKAMREGNIWKALESVWTAFKAAGDTFVKHLNGGVQIWAAAMDWFQEEWGRDTFISLPGLLLTTGRYDEAKANMRGFAKYEHDGLIPNRITDAARWSPQKPDGVEYNTVDGSMWFVQAVKKYVEYSKDEAFLDEMLPVLRRIMSRYAAGTGYYRYGRFNRIMMGADGLIESPAQATWMDADPDGKDRPVTPRNGKAVEINALWYANLRFLARLERRAGAAAAAKTLDERADLVKKSFNDKFWFVSADNQRAWGETGGALRDVVEGDPHGDAIRPNMLFAVSHGEDLLSPERQRAVVLAATKDLLTPYGLRTLSPRDSNYRAVYETWKPPVEKDQAYHQGTTWPWLIGAYVDALVRVRKEQGWDEGRIQAEVRGVLAPLVEALVSQAEGSLNEVYDGGQPQDAMKGFSLADPLGLAPVVAKLLRLQNRGGTRSQAWSVAEVMRALREHGGVR